MSSWTYDSDQHGLLTVLRDYEVEELRFLWKSGDYRSTREVYEAVNEALTTKTISRASVINSLARLATLGVLDSSETTGKGGHRSLYKTKYDEEQLKRHIFDTLTKSMKSNLL